MRLTWPDDFINKVICGDCLEILPQIPDGAVDLLLTDLPYGLNRKMNGGTWGEKYGNGDMKRWDYVVSENHLREMFRVSKHQIIWGGNLYPLPPTRAWLVWEKPNLPTLSDVELAWTSFDFVSKIYRHNRIDYKYHPTEKPVEIMSWSLQYRETGDIVLDCCCGSGSTLVAAKQLGRRYIGIEIEPKYCKIAEDRLDQAELFIQPEIDYGKQAEFFNIKTERRKG